MDLYLNDAFIDTVPHWYRNELSVIVVVVLVARK